MESFEMQAIGVVTSAGQYERKKEFARRSRLEICMDLLKAVKEGCSRPTPIMYRTNLSWIALQTNIKTLVDGGMLRWVESGNRKICEMTEKGRTVLTSYGAIKEEIEGALDGIVR